VSVETYWLVIRADRSARIVRRPRRLAIDEISIRLKVTFPDGWGTIVDTLDIDAPAFRPEIVPAPEEAEA
jgi:hypothetical protein